MKFHVRFFIMEIIEQTKHCFALKFGLQFQNKLSVWVLFGGIRKS